MEGPKVFNVGEEGFRWSIKRKGIVCPRHLGDGRRLDWVCPKNPKNLDKRDVRPLSPVAKSIKGEWLNHFQEGPKGDWPLPV